MPAEYKLTVVVPLFNEAGRMKLLKSGLEDLLARPQEVVLFEILLVNDGSHDDTKLELDQLVEEFNGRYGNLIAICAIHLSSNQGKGAALKAGVLESSGDWILTMDADIATHPCELFKWQDSLGASSWQLDKFDTVHIGSREHVDSIVACERGRQLMGRCFNLINRVINQVSVKDTQCGFKLYPGDSGRQLFQELRTKGWAHDVEIIMNARSKGLVVQEQPITWHAIEGSKINPLKDAIRMFLESIRIRVYRLMT